MALNRHLYLFYHKWVLRGLLRVIRLWPASIGTLLKSGISLLRI